MKPDLAALVQSRDQKQTEEDLNTQLVILKLLNVLLVFFEFCIPSRLDQGVEVMRAFIVHAASYAWQHHAPLTV